MRMIEGEQSFVVECGQELNREEGIAGRLVADEPRERRDALAAPSEAHRRRAASGPLVRAAPARSRARPLRRREWRGAFRISGWAGPTSLSR